MTLKPRSKTLVAAVTAAVLFALWPAPAFADDFGEIVHHIEVRYHAHRNYRFLMAFAGWSVKLWPGIGVREVKIAFFENQNLFPSDPDKDLDEILRQTGKAGWQQMVKSHSRRRGEISYVYVQPSGKDLKLLVVNLEHNEAEVIEVKIDPDKLEKFIAVQEHHGHEDVM
ncbi:MAG TPA: hypothetical protein VKW06_06365 [Candidatus Angelobacter sp.]|nr:hypothetical protein [Candidatus Angelobacter sp.]